MRNDSTLYTGATSASYASIKRRVRNEEKLLKQTTLVKDAPVVFEEIEKHKQMLGELLLKLTTSKDAPEDIRDTLNALRIHRQWVDQLENKLKIVLKAKPLKKEASHEG